MTTIAAIIPIGDPRLYGYGNVLAECLQSVDDFADFTILVQSHPAKDALYPYIHTLRNVYVISDKSTWFIGGIYDGRQIDKNLDVGLEMATNHGAQTALYFSSNWYIPVHSRAGLRRSCEDVNEFAYLYRGDQLAGQLFSASKRLPMIVEIGAGFRYKFSVDMTIGETSLGFPMITPDRGDWSNYDDQMVIDVPFEITELDLSDKMNACRCYADVLPKRAPVYDWKYWDSYYRAKFAEKKPCSLPLDHYGQRIATKSQNDYLSNHFLKELSYAPA